MRADPAAAGVGDVNAGAGPAIDRLLGPVRARTILDTELFVCRRTG